MLPPNEPTVTEPTVPDAAGRYANGFDAVIVSFAWKVPVIFIIKSAYESVSGLYSFPTTTAVASEIAPVITSPRFKQT